MNYMITLLNVNKIWPRSLEHYTSRFRTGPGQNMGLEIYTEALGS